MANAEKYYWQQIWFQALDNMPGKRSPYMSKWRLLDRPVSIPELIKGQAYDRLRLYNGQVYRKHFLLLWDLGDQMHHLTELLELHGHCHRKNCICCRRVQRGINHGTKLKDPKKRVLLEKLANPDTGKELAKTLLSKEARK